jgi:hypothetical protein
MKRQSRPEKLIAEFEGGYAKGWFMAIGEHYRNELDISLSERKKNKVSYFVWTQGPYFCFSVGNVFYDNKAAYEDIWQKAIKKISVACQIISATPCKLNDNGDFIDGAVEFKVFYKNNSGDGLVLAETQKSTQTKFVNFLKTGKLID